MAQQRVFSASVAPQFAEACFTLIAIRSRKSTRLPFSYKIHTCTGSSLKQGSIQKHNNTFTHGFVARSMAPECAEHVKPTVLAYADSQGSGFKKPEVIEWRDDMIINGITCIGTVARDVDIKYLDSGKIVATTSIKVKRKLKEDSWLLVEFWDNLAEVAAAHIKKDQSIFVSGSVSVESFEGKDGIHRKICKVAAMDLKFVRSMFNNAERVNSIRSMTIEHLWTDLFDNPSLWWDNRSSKGDNHLSNPLSQWNCSDAELQKSPDHPDFREKLSSVGLWIKSKSTPDWVYERLEEVRPVFSEPDPEVVLLPTLSVDEAWEIFFMDPSKWWDNRTSKKSPRYPDFKHKVTGQALWVNSFYNPRWVKEKLRELDSYQDY